MKFTDTKSREYECKVSLQTVIDLRRIGVNLNDLFKTDSDLIARLDADPELLVNTLCVICDESIKANCSGDDIAREFASSLGGDTLQSANAAMWEAIASFYPRLRQSLMTLWTKSEAVKDLQQTAAQKAADSLTVESLLTLSGRAGNSQDSQAE